MRDKQLFILFIVSLVVAVIDLAFIVFSVIELILAISGSSFIVPFFWILALTTIAINVLFLSIIGIYFLVRNRK